MSSATSRTPRLGSFEARPVRPFERLQADRLSGSFVQTGLGKNFTSRPYACRLAGIGLSGVSWRELASFWVVIPAHNEEASIGDVVSDILRDYEVPVLVVDDLSTDRTVERARQAGALVLPLPIQLGAWCATQTGIRFALAHDCHILVTLDGDGQHRPEDIPNILSPLWQGEADVIIGSCLDRGSKARKLAWRVFRWITGLDVRDLTSGFRAYNRAALEILSRREATLLDYQDVGVLLFLKRAGFRFREVAVTMCPRKNGHSRVFSTWGAVASYLLYSGVVSVSKRSYGSAGRTRRTENL